MSKKSSPAFVEDDFALGNFVDENTPDGEDFTGPNCRNHTASDGSDEYTSV